ncbi:MAG: hypothetical protein HWE20_09860 [Gammaproteobacteria bacterium]|nr:hypothetical protein [Gammaproteobacteria bacterium]
MTLHKLAPQIIVQQPPPPPPEVKMPDINFPEIKMPDVNVDLGGLPAAQNLSPEILDVLKDIRDMLPGIQDALSQNGTAPESTASPGADTSVPAAEQPQGSVSNEPVAAEQPSTGDSGAATDASGQADDMPEGWEGAVPSSSEEDKIDFNDRPEFRVKVKNGETGERFNVATHDENADPSEMLSDILKGGGVDFGEVDFSDVKVLNERRFRVNDDNGNSAIVRIHDKYAGTDIGDILDTLNEN